MKSSRQAAPRPTRLQRSSGDSRSRLYAVRLIPAGFRFLDLFSQSRTRYAAFPFTSRTRDSFGDPRRSRSRRRYGYPATSADDGYPGAERAAELQPMDRRLRELRTRLRRLAATLLECRFFLPTQTRAMPAALTFPCVPVAARAPRPKLRKSTCSSSGTSRGSGVLEFCDRVTSGYVRTS